MKQLQWLYAEKLMLIVLTSINLFPVFLYIHSKAPSKVHLFIII